MLNEKNTLLEDDGIEEVKDISLEEDGIEEEILVDEEVAITKAMWGDIGGNIENQTDLQNALDSKQDSLTEAQLNAVNSGITSEKVTTYDGYADQIASKADQSALNAETIARGEADTDLGTRIDNEALARQSADNGLQTQIDAITSKSDVVDVVANYAALQAYDTSTLGNNDVVKVLDDETHEDALTYYRWSTTTQTWTYIGQEAPYYSKGQMDVMLQGKQNTLTAGANIQIENGVISATDTKYTAGNGLNLNGTEFSADTDVLATKEDLEDYYTKPEADNLLAPKLEAEVVAELPTTGEEGKLYLTPKAHTTQTATGNPIEATVSEEAGALESFKLDGDTTQQTYTGKNLLPLGGSYDTGLRGIVNADGSLTIRGTAEASKGFKVFTTTRQFPAGTYTLSISSALSSVLNLTLASNVGFRIPAGETSITTTLGQNYGGGAVFFAAKSGQEYDITIKAQLVSGSTPDYDFEPYVGGQPSPSPDYPQPIQTVTGLQTISINGTDYPIDLGDIQLCGLGDDGNGNPLYKDYIYPDGDDWKVHKATNKITVDGSENWQYPDSGANYTFFQFSRNNFRTKYGNAADFYASSTEVGFAKADKFEQIVASSANMRTKQGIGFSTEGNGWFRISVANTIATTVDVFKTWLSSHSTTIDYALATPTDTNITDTTLIAQLEAIRTASLQNGVNTITNTATGSNLAGDMEVGYFGYNPRNRYDKWLWLDINNEYERIGN